MTALSANLQQHLACPDCKAPLEFSSGAARCARCASSFPATAAGVPDLRPRKDRSTTRHYATGSGLDLPADIDLAPLEPHPSPALDLARITVPYHLSRELISHFPRAQSPQDIALDLGCGNAPHRGVCEAAGFDYAGVDFCAPEAPLLADAHALPFANESVAFILSIAVLEHLRFPGLAMQEALRVLRPGGMMIGTVAFLEPFHELSFYHHTHLGVYNTLASAGFQVERIAPSAQWTGLEAQARMGLYPYMPGWISSALFLPHRILHRLWWQLGRHVDPRATEILRLLSNSGSFAFIARKPARAA